jgi:type III secretion protein U
MSEKTEQPTPKKLRDAREKGQVCKSQEITSAAGILVVFGFMIVAWEFWEKHVRELFSIPFAVMHLPFHEALPLAVGGVWNIFLLLVFPVLALVIVAALVANVGQVGVLFSMQPAMPSLNKLNPQQWFKKVFSKKNLLELCKSVIKTLLLAYIIQKIILNSIDAMVKAPVSGLASQVSLLGDIIFHMYIYTCAAFIVVAAIDYLLQKKIHTQELMMTKEEVKREYKEMEGDPHIKSQRKQLHMEMVMNESMQKVRQSSVLITNPTHVAVALYYKEGKTPLPIINAKGEGALAKRMMRIAEEEGIPIMRDVPLARGLFSQAQEDAYIPGEFIEPVAEVIRWLREVTGQQGETT